MELEEAVLNLAPWAVGGGLIGARIVHILDNWSFYSQDLSRIVMLNQGGIALYGGIIGGSLAALIVAQRQHLPSGLIADVAAPGLLVGQAIGRVGDIITASVKEADPTADGPAKAGKVVHAVIVRTRRAFQRPDGTVIRFDDNAAVLINKETKDPIGTRVFGPVARELRERQFSKIISLAPEVL